MALEATAKGWYKAALKRYEGKLKSELESQTTVENAVAASEEQKWITLKDEFICHFTPNSVIKDALLRQRVFASTQKNKDSVATYASELLSLLHQTKSEPFTEKQQIDVFISGLKTAIKVVL